jgi:hypothetical protein
MISRDGLDDVASSVPYFSSFSTLHHALLPAEALSVFDKSRPCL